jgi:hypothetical protein
VPVGSVKAGSTTPSSTLLASRNCSRMRAWSVSLAVSASQHRARAWAPPRSICRGDGGYVDRASPVLRTNRLSEPGVSGRRCYGRSFSIGHRSIRSASAANPVAWGTVVIDNCNPGTRT